MPDLTDRLTHEGELARSIRTAFGKQRRRVAAAGAGADWSEFETELSASLNTHLGATFSIASENMVKTQVDDEEAATALLLLLLGGRGITGLLPRASSDWSQGVSGLLAGQISANSRDTISRSQDDTIPPETRPSLKDASDKAFSTDRAEGIAATETTRAVSQGEAFARQRIEQEMQKAFTAIWVTEADDRVCPICRPLHRKPELEWPAAQATGPPAHPVCRCFLVYRTG